ncbi:MAG: hypothetical protein KGR26_09375, partial [Cyanobacteria bacterium REEB65]|nr:hypothetical protein [Cyanobacteria bacterium REEB65]
LESLGPEYTRVGETAIELTQDFNWGSWVTNMGRIGFSAQWIEDVLHKMAGRGELNMSVGHGILKRYQRQGGTDDEVKPQTSCRPTAAPAVSVDHSKRYLRANPDDVHPKHRKPQS